jgi:hypothetical protein
MSAPDTKPLALSKTAIAAALYSFLVAIPAVREWVAENPQLQAAMVTMIMLGLRYVTRSPVHIIKP